MAMKRTPLRAWSWLRGKPPKGHVHFNMECDLVRYENIIETIVRIHSQNLLGENNPEMFKNYFRKNTCR
jgi:hypothetical protein